MAKMSIKGIVSYVYAVQHGSSFKFQLFEHVDDGKVQCFNVSSPQVLELGIGTEVEVVGEIVWACEKKYCKNTVGYIHLESIVFPAEEIEESHESVEVKSPAPKGLLSNKEVARVDGEVNAASSSNDGVAVENEPLDCKSQEVETSSERVRRASAGDFSQYLMGSSSGLNSSDVDQRSKWSGPAEDAEVAPVRGGESNSCEQGKSSMSRGTDGKSTDVSDNNDLAKHDELANKAANVGVGLVISKDASSGVSAEMPQGFDVCTSAVSTDSELSDEAVQREQYLKAVGSTSDVKTDLNLDRGW
ncbi:hypothetical protein F7U66_01005 [Vibrio parahaemolyticus]|nr:hypothetical protein [Vibrio parahaemolyticus]